VVADLLVAPRADIPIVIGRDAKNNPITLDALFSRMYLLPLYQRAGGVSAPSNGDLEATVNAIVAGEMVMQPASAQQGFPDVMQTAACACPLEMIFQ
jgi:hypothetical protein